MKPEYNEFQNLKLFINKVHEQTEEIDEKIDECYYEFENLKKLEMRIKELLEKPELICENEEQISNDLALICKYAKKYHLYFQYDKNLIYNFKKNPYDYFLEKDMISFIKSEKFFLLPLYREITHELDKLKYRREDCIIVTTSIKIDENNRLKKPIDDEKNIKKIYKLISMCNIRMSDHNTILMELNKLNLEAFLERDRLLEARKKRLEKRVKQEEKTITPIALPSLNKAEDLNNKKERLETKLSQILEENKFFIEHGYSEEAKIGFKLFKENYSNNYFVEKSLDTCLGIILLDIEEKIKKISNITNQNELEEIEKTISAYDEYKKLKLQEKQNYLISEKIIQENLELLQKAKICNIEYEKIISNFTEQDLKYIDSIDQYFKDLEEEIDVTVEQIDNYDKISNFIKSITSGNQNFTINKYYKYKKLERIYKSYNEFIECINEISKNLTDEISDDLALAEISLESLEQALNEYILSTAKDEENEKLTSEKETNNNIIYLFLNDEETSFMNFIEKDNFDYKEKNMRQIFSLINKLESRDSNDIFVTSTKVKDSPYNEKIRRLRSSEYRLIFIQLNNINNIKLTLDKPCYVIIAAAKKHDNSIYKYANSDEIEQALNKLAHFIQENIKKIECEPISSEEKQIKINQFINNFVVYNNNKFNESITLPTNETEQTISVSSKRK